MIQSSKRAYKGTVRHIQPLHNCLIFSDRDIHHKQLYESYFHTHTYTHTAPQTGLMSLHSDANNAYTHFASVTIFALVYLFPISF